ncbi:hypothetical protein FGIG_11376 [Fasciola gigantica]|uniref:Uncharacterized protein n=1 Tax=Fasciola gigantica TaxID=46835 RepID=A0A504YTJ8_FASGI|nr:hypothetical protein FGIG_11376 [Fasciola gigantica]
MAFATRTLDFANVDALLKAAELLEGTLNRGFGGGVEKADSDLGLSMDIFAHKHEPTLANSHPNGGKTDCLSKRTQKNHSVVVHPSRQDILRMKADNTSPDFWAKITLMC